jgi:mRNA interferase MazF
MVKNKIKQGNIYILDFGKPKGSEPGYKRPCIVIQNDLLNQSAINTTIVCIITSNLNLAKIPTNILLKKSKSGLKKDSVINTSQVFTVNKSQLTKKIRKVPPSIIKTTIKNVFRNISF